MARPYSSEMGELRQTLDWVSETDIAGLSAAISRGWSGPLVAVGSGGSFSAANHLARLHRTFFGQVANASTPFRLVSEPIAVSAGHWIFSAGGSNVDVLAAARAATLGEPISTNIVTMKARSRIVDLYEENPFVSLHVLDAPSKKDGFLATNSLLAFCALFSRCYLGVVGRGQEWARLNESLTALVDPTSARVASFRDEAAKIASTDHLVVLHGSETNLGGVDLESKLIEAGIKNVQLADYRHFAHGRHHWIAKHPESTGILAFVSDSDDKLANRTLRLLPSDVPCARINIDGSGEQAEIESLLAAFYLTEELGFAQGIDPGQPGVPDFGRKIYSLRVPEQVAPSAGSAAIRRKMLAQGPQALVDRDAWQINLNCIMERLCNTSLSGVVLDYDGTVVDTHRRWDAPTSEMCSALQRLVDAGLSVGIATGRGRSAGDSLRGALPRSTWSKVLIGYYNGAEVLRLDESDGPDRERPPTSSIADLYEAIQNRRAVMPPLQIDLRPYQLTVTPSAAADAETLWTDVSELIDERALGGIRLVRSSHSIDAVDRSASKLNVVKAMDNHDDVLRIGDRGRWPGNDFQLLAHPLGFSVDQVSGHPEQCWNIAPPGVLGSRATLHYLHAITLEDVPRIRMVLP